MSNLSKKREKLKAKYAEPLPISDKLNYWCADTIESIRRNFVTQGIFPVGEPYQGYRARNSKAAESGRRHSTGAGYDSFYFQVLNAAQNQDMVPTDVAVKLLYNYYLKFVDMGVMSGLTADKVQKSRAAQFDQQYFNTWSPKTGDTMRPAISMEIDYQTKRLGMYLTKQYEAEAQMIVLNAVDGLEIKLK